MSQQINLFNPIFLKQKKYFSAVTMLQLSGVVVVALVLFTLYASSQVAALTADLEGTGKQRLVMQDQLVKATTEFTPRQKSKSIQDDIARVEAELSSQREVFAVVNRGGLGNTKGYSEYLRAFSRQIASGIWITGLSIVGPGSEIELHGRTLQADALPAYINRLKSEPVMKGKSFAMLEMQVPTIEIEAKDDKGAVTSKRGPAGYLDFSLQTKVTEVDPNEATAMESTRGLAPAAPAAPGLTGLNSGGAAK